MTLPVKDSSEIWRISNLHCCCFLCSLARSSADYSSLWTFTNLLFIKHCHQNISN